MSETKEKKVRVAAVAAQINVPSEDIISFLQKKGYAVKTVNSPVSDEMMIEIDAQFKKQIEGARKHQAKVEEYKTIVGTIRSQKDEKPGKEDKKAKSDKPAKTDAAEELVTPETTAAPEPVLVEEEQGTLVAESAVVEEHAPEQVVPVKEEPGTVVVPEAAPVEPKAEPVAETIAEPVQVTAPAPVAEKAPVVDVKVEKPQVPAPAVKETPAPEAETKESNKAVLSAPKKPMGLKILGNINDRKPAGGASKGDGDEDATPAVKSPQSSADLDKKKKKKKKTKVKKKVDSPNPEDLLVVKKKQKVKKFEIDQKEIDKNIRVTMLGMDETAALSNRAKERKKKKQQRLEMSQRLEEEKLLDEKRLRVPEFIAVSELANLMDVSVSDVISKCISLGLMVSINQRLDVDTITLVADEFGFEIEIAKEYAEDVLEDTHNNDSDLLFPRSPVVTIMGHVDHGKTSLLDFIRRTNVVAGESGGITQHIGAYKVKLPNGREVTFLDTPGHEAFTAMRARGAQVTDIVVLVVAADDAVMPQTIEAINHAQAANVPIIVAINKIDRPEANTQRIKQQLGDRNILVEEWGGKYQCIELSAKTGLNVDTLLEKILLETDMMELRANPDRPARGVVIESELDKGRGITATVLVQKGTLRVGDPFIAGVFFGKVRAMFDERNNRVDEAPPSTPVSVLGFEGAPQAGDVFIVMESERDARDIALKRQQLKREQDNRQVKHLTLDEISRQISIGGVKELPIIVKGDVDGSVEALADSFMKLSNEEVVVRVIHRGVGAISESDVLLADASNAIIIGFHVRPHLNARKLAEANKVDIRIYNIIYNAIAEVKAALEGLLSPVISEEVTATVSVRDTFKVPKVGTVAGCYVLEGKLVRNNKIRIIREGIVVFEGELDSLKRFKDDVREVDAGYECGLSVHNFNDVKIGDVLEAYRIIETKKKLD
jgi:translation initiation factor IF-2